jgi:hypothetical protein
MIRLFFSIAYCVVFHTPTLIVVVLGALRSLPDEFRYEMEKYNDQPHPARPGTVQVR